MKTTKEIASDCGLTEGETELLEFALSDHGFPAGLSTADATEIIKSLYRRIELFERSEQLRKDMGIQTEDAKWLDLECYSGCQSLVLKHRIEALEAESKMPDKVREALDHVRLHHSVVTMVLFDVNSRWHYLDEDAEAPAFGSEIDISLLEDAADSVNGDLPRLFVWQARN